MLRYVGLAVLFALVYLLILRPVKNQMVALLQAPLHHALPGSNAAGGTGASLAADGSLGGLPRPADSMSTEVQEAIALKKAIVSKVNGDPEAASRLIQNWLRESEATK
jgi:hypothetical protein